MVYQFIHGISIYIYLPLLFCVCICSVLREAKESAELECEQLRRRLDKSQHELALQSKELTALETAKESDLSELRAQLKIKSYEFSSIAANSEVAVSVGSNTIDILLICCVIYVMIE